MQTFLPYPDFDASARTLDDRRLGKQRVEALQVLRALTRPAYGWKHHPAVRMWRGHEEALGAYGVAVCREWRHRGHADTCEAKILDELREAGFAAPPRSQARLARAGALPRWLGEDEVHRSHRAALLRKDPERYGDRFGDEDPDLPYAWPAGPGPA
ncbi:MAG TPA: MSMEG_6728 family protein [Acidimicrobiales bacterium]